MKIPFMAGLFLMLCLSLSCVKLPSKEAAKAPERKGLLSLPQLKVPPVIDGDLSEWKYHAFSDGVWDLARVRQSPWYEADRNRLADHSDEPSPEEDLQARYYMAWDSAYLYLGAEVWDNVNDVTESRHAPKRWYYKDAIAWFVEAPSDTLTESFGEGDHGFAFVIDSTYPDYGAWWRRGNADTTFLEDPLPPESVKYRIQMNPWGRNPADYVLEARIEMAATLGSSDPDWHTPREGDLYRMMIVHCDPDGGEYGGHLLIYGRGDADSSWHTVQLSGPESWEARREK